MNKFITILLLGIITTAASADRKDFYYQRFLHRTHGKVKTTPKKPDVFYTQKVNHDDPNDARAYQQRYFVNSQYASGPDAPVFFYLCGEAACSAGVLTGAIQVYAQNHKAYLVALEHRYYGISQPMPTLSAANLKYLTTKQALQDAADFVTWFKAGNELTGKWIVFGGSYPGSLAAYFRSSYPNLVAGALSSSGPVKALANFEEYDHHVWQVAGPECAAAIQKVTAIAEAAMKDPAQLLAMEKQFEAEALTNPVDFLYLIADMGALAIQYGYQDQFCKLITGSDPVAGYAQFTKGIYQSWQMTAVSDSSEGAVSEDWADYADGIGDRAWTYQTCTEYGYWQVAYHDPSQSARSQQINLQYHLNMCNTLFGITTPVDESKINDSLYGSLLASPTSQILFTNGSDDPWSLLGISSFNGNAVNPNTDAYLIDGSSHCADLGTPMKTDSASLAGARDFFEELVTNWLKS
jgi:pimeloyl-ACP methyl ester carboxylesterase